MTTSVQTFHFCAPGDHELLKIRTITLEGRVLLAAFDVCRALGLKSTGSNTWNHTQKLDDDEKITLRRGSNNPSIDAVLAPNLPALVMLTQSGLYKLMMRADKKEALAFQNWAAREVFPSIQATGSYALADHGRTEMPLPAGFGELLKANLAMAELLAQALTKIDDLTKVRDRRMYQAAQIVKLSRFRGHNENRIAQAVSDWCVARGYEMGLDGGVRTYPMYAVAEWADNAGH